VQSGAVVEGFDVVKDGGANLGEAGEAIVVNEFVFEVNAMLLNEFLKEHRQVQEQKTTISELKSAMTQQQKQIEALTAGLQKVSAQLEVSDLYRQQSRTIIKAAIAEPITRSSGDTLH
jgi:hypothetical protein